MTTKHTPGPWWVAPSDAGVLPTSPPPAIYAGPKRKRDRQTVAYLGGGSIHYADARPNAEFICRACNSHGELLAALRELVRIARTGDLDAVDAALDAAEAAIAKAEGVLA